MKGFIITYDLLKAGQNYATLIKQLETWKAVRIQQSTWILSTALTSTQIHDGLVPHLDANDKLFVGRLDAACWKSMGMSMDNWLKSIIV